MYLVDGSEESVGKAIGVQVDVYFLLFPSTLQLLKPLVKGNEDRCACLAHRTNCLVIEWLALSQPLDCVHVLHQNMPK